MRAAAALLALSLVAAAPAPNKPSASKAAANKPAPTSDETAIAADRPADGSDTDTKAAGGQKPVWEVATVTPDAVEVAKSTYIVQPGDTLSAVVRKTKAGADVIAHENDLKPPFVLRPGQKLAIPAGRYHMVRKGQSGIAISRAYGVEWQKIIAINHLKEPYTLREGQRLMLPPAKEVAKMTLEQRAAAFKIDLTDLATGSEPALAPSAKPATPSPSPTRQLAPTTPVAEPPAAFTGRFDWPIEGKIIRAYGPTANGGRNDGITIAATRGSPIGAAADGVVMWVGEHPAFGNVVLVRHGGGWITIYGNADKLLVKRGQSVKRSQTIARVGMTGSSADQPQTFFEVLQGKKPVNPMDLLPKRSGKDNDAVRDQDDDSRENELTNSD
jgi:murein DD-endopeptidase MepM/ murein hydrolase activator NlpD